MLKLTAEELAEAICTSIDAVVTPLVERIRTLEEGRRADAERIKALEDKPALTYRGTWEPGREYSVGDATTRDGSLWICKLHHSFGVPGVDHVGWQLAVKRGKDGRDRGAQ